jgi:hypothetical protein
MELGRCTYPHESNVRRGPLDLESNRRGWNEHPVRR